MQLNEADNALTDAARLSLFRGKLLERAEEIGARACVSGADQDPAMPAGRTV